MATQAQIDDLFEKLEKERATLLASLTEVGEDQAEVQPPEGEGEEGWSVKEQLTHLAGMDRSYRQWVIRALAEDRPDTSDGNTPNVPLDVPQDEAHSADLPTLIAQMNAERAETLELARGIDPEQYERTGARAGVRRADGDAVAALVLPPRPHASRADPRRRVGLRAELRRGRVGASPQPLSRRPSSHTQRALGCAEGSSVVRLWPAGYPRRERKARGVSPQNGKPAGKARGVSPQNGKPAGYPRRTESPRAASARASASSSSECASRRRPSGPRGGPPWWR